MQGDKKCNKSFSQEGAGTQAMWGGGMYKGKGSCLPNITYYLLS